MRGRRLSGHLDICPRCGNCYAHVYIVCDAPHTEETRCADCDSLISVNGKRVPTMDESCMAFDGEGRR